MQNTDGAMYNGDAYRYSDGDGAKGYTFVVFLSFKKKCPIINSAFLFQFHPILSSQRMLFI